MYEKREAPGENGISVTLIMDERNYTRNVSIRNEFLKHVKMQ